MDDKQKSRLYFDSHSSTFINRNGYWNYDYRMTSKILKRRNVKNLIDIGCGNGAFLAMFHKESPETKISGLDIPHEMVMRCRERIPDGRMRKAKRKFLRIEMLVVRPEYQKQGYMRKMMEYAYRLADRSCFFLQSMMRYGRLMKARCTWRRH